MSLITTKEIIQEIRKGENEHWDYEHFHASNMADYTTLSTTIDDLVMVYGISHEEAGEVIDALTH